MSEGTKRNWSLLQENSGSVAWINYTTCIIDGRSCREWIQSFNPYPVNVENIVSS